MDRIKDNMKIMIDLDDVVADWFGHASVILGKRVGRGYERVSKEEWSSLKVHPHLYGELPLREGATELVNWCLDYKAKTPNVELRFLTAIPGTNDMPFAFSDKVFWGQKYFPEIPVTFGPYSVDKWRHCTPGDILIDDRVTNNEAWANAGGRAHLYRNWPDCKVWLEDTLK